MDAPPRTPQPGRYKYVPKSLTELQDLMVGMQSDGGKILEVHCRAPLHGKFPQAQGILIDTNRKESQ